MKTELSEKWIKASIAGTIWAASEIVLGSFLHNLKIPFSGNILTAIGLIILVALSHRWKENGLFWRAGLICALLKTMSPSAVIFGPMIAIFTESVLLETSVRILGRTYAGFILGSMLAMSWNLVQKIVNYIIFFGSDIIGVYTNLLKYAQKQFDIRTDIVWLPLIILLAGYALFGAVSAVLGIRVGKKLLNEQGGGFTGKTGNSKPYPRFNARADFNYSLAWLALDLGMLFAGLLILNRTQWFIWVPSVTAFILALGIRYRRAMRQLSKPGFWLLFVFLTLITAFIFTEAESGKDLLIKGLLTGLQMNFRAALVIVGFSALGTEFYNPVIRNFFRKTAFRNLPLSLELAAESLPSVIATIPDFRTLVKNPVSVFYSFLSEVDGRLDEIKNLSDTSQRVYFVSGSVSEGKTSFLKGMIRTFREKNFPVGGVLLERVINKGHTEGYDIVDITTEARQVFLREKTGGEEGGVGRFSIDQRGLELGRSVLNSLAGSGMKLVIVDEVGMLELGNGGWAEQIDLLRKNQNMPLLMAVRDKHLEAVAAKWGIFGYTEFRVSESDPSDAATLILSEVSR